jgi:uncharacterized protein with PIN domain
MILDASALVAMVLSDPLADALLLAIEGETTPMI